jgi:hypothetical protein
MRLRPENSGPTWVQYLILCTIMDKFKVQTLEKLAIIKIVVTVIVLLRISCSYCNRARPSVVRQRVADKLSEGVSAT